ncbi:unnamed protein product [Prunus armeniaca]|uniref:Uncharacterized protein n=1 Tax=Prunus armeniaca TaxID=36596 RepID=A0A6J5TE89_PRUAR|nr:unnamed protein product [Prunus armeniaca]
MTVWRATNPDARYFPVDMGFANLCIAKNICIACKYVRKSFGIIILKKQGRLRNKVQENRKHFFKRREVESNNENQTLPSKENVNLLWKEQLELREIQGWPNALGCSDHFTTNGDHACSLCNDFLPKFPPNSVKMKHPFCMQPWDSSPEIVKKLFKGS